MSPVTISQPSMCMRSKSVVALVGVRTITRTSCPSPQRPDGGFKAGRSGDEDLHGRTSTSV